jgi:hypothetical protein
LQSFLDVLWMRGGSVSVGAADGEAIPVRDRRDLRALLNVVDGTGHA